MPTLQEILQDQNYLSANPATKKAIFDRWSASDTNYTGANPATQQAIRSRFGVGGAEVASPVEPPKDKGFFSNVGSLLVEGGKRAIGAAQVSPSVIAGDVGEDKAKLLSEQLSMKPSVQPKQLVEAQTAFKDEAEAFEKAKGFTESIGPFAGFLLEFGKQVITNPKGAVYLTAQSAANMAPQIAGMIAGGKGAALAASPAGPQVAALAGAAGAVGGGFAAGVPLEIGSEFIGRIGEKLAERGLEPTEENIAALLRDKAVVEQAISEARTKGVTTAAVDSLMTVGAGKFASGPRRAAIETARKEMGATADAAKLAARADEILKARTMTQKVGRGAGAVGIETAGGGISEAAGQAAAYGKVDLEDVGAEMLGELGGSAISVPAAAYSTTQDMLKSKAKTDAASILADEEKARAEAPPVVKPAAAEPSPTVSMEPPPAAAPIAAPLPPVSATPAGPVAPKEPAVPVAKAPKTTDWSNDYTENLPPEAGSFFQNRDRSAPASVGQMQSIAANPDYSRLSVNRDFGSGAPVVISDLPISENQFGKVAYATASDGTRIPVRYAVIEGNDITPSNTSDGTKNPEYGDLSVSAIRPIAGNGRVAGLRAAYNQGTADNYKRELLEDTEHGINPDIIGGFQNPVLVRVMPKSQVTENIADISNISGTLRLSPVESAKNDIGRVNLGGLTFNDDGSPNTNTLIQFVRSMPKDEQGELIDAKGMPNTKAIDRLNNAIFYKAYGSDTLIELYAQAADQEAKAVLNALAKAAPKMAALDGAGEFDVRASVLDAAEMAVNARRSGQKLKDYVQQGMLGADPYAIKVLEMFADNSRSSKRMAEALDRLATLAGEQASKSGSDMFGDVPKMPKDDLYKALVLEPEAEPDLFAPPVAPTTPAPAAQETDKTPEQREAEKTDDDLDKRQAQLDREAEINQREAKLLEERKRLEEERLKLEGLAGQPGSTPKKTAISPEQERREALDKFKATLSIGITPFKAVTAKRTQLLKPSPLTSAQIKEIIKLASDALDLGLPSAVLGNVTAAGSTRMDVTAVMSANGSLMIAKKWPLSSSAQKLQVLIHELAHAVDTSGGNIAKTTNWSKAHTELQGWYTGATNKAQHPLTYPFAPQFVGRVRPKEESFAQAFSFYFTSPVDLQTNAPEAYSQIQSIVERIQDGSQAARAAGTTATSTAGIKIQPSRASADTEVRPDAGEERAGVSGATRLEDRGAGEVTAKTQSQIYTDADAIAEMDEDVRDNMEVGEVPGGSEAYNLYEARNLLKKPSEKLKRVTDSNSFSLWQDWDYIANVDGEYFGVSKEEDPDALDGDEDSFVYAYARLDDPRNIKTTATSDAAELISEIRADSVGKKPTAMRKTTEKGVTKPSIAYHAGDLKFGKDTVLGRMMGGRSTGHFGTGVYFVGDKSNLESRFSPRKDRPIQEVDFNKYNLFRPTTNYTAQRLDDGLREINSLVERNIDDQEDFKAAVKKAVSDLAYATDKDEKSILAAIRKHLEKTRDLAEKNAFESTYIPTLATEVMQELGYEGVDVRGLDRYDNAEYGSVIFGREVLPDAELQDINAMQATPTRQNIFGEPVLGTWSITTDPKMELQDGLIYKLLDKNIDLKRIIEAVKSTGKEIATKWNPYLQEELYHGRTAEASKQFQDNEWLPLLQDMQKKDVTIGALEKYLLNRHAEDYNKLVAKRNPTRPEMQDGGSSVTTEAAREYLAGLDKDTKAKYEELAKRVDGITKGTRKLLVDTGYEKAETVEGWEKAFPNYVPLMREEMDFDYNFGSFGTGRGFDVRRNFSRSAMGSKRNVVDIIGNVIAARNNAIALTEKNRVAQAVYGLALEAPNPDFWMAINPEAEKVPEDAIDELRAMGLDEDAVKFLMKEPKQRMLDPKKNEVISRVNTKLRENDFVLATRVNGEKRYVLFNPKDPRSARAATALKNLDAQDLGTTMGMIAKVTRWMASVNTQYNPIFGPYNFLRDIQAGALQLSTTELAGQQKEIAKLVVPSMGAIYSSLRKRRKGETVDSDMAKLWKEFQSEGGQTGFRDNFSRTQDRTEALLTEMEKLTEGKLKAGGRAVFDWLSDYNDSLENAVRLSAYKVAKEKFKKEGFSDAEAKQKAASLAKNLTVNFNRKGDVATQMGALYAFFNASMQGSARMIETLKGPTGKKIMAGGLLLGSMQALLLSAAGFDDEEPPEFIRSKNILIPTGDGNYVAFPMPLGYHVIPGISRILTEWAMSGFKDTARRVTDLTGLFLDAFNPVGNAGWSVQTIAPTILDPLVALGENKDFTGKPISKEDMFSLNPTPGYSRAREGANFLTTALAEFLNAASGGDKDRQGVISPTPEQIEYLIGQATGGVGRELVKLTTTIDKTITGEELPPYKIPLYGRFVGETKSAAAESNKFYKNMKELNELNNVVTGRRERKEPLGDFVKENPQARLLPLANKTFKDVQELRKRRKALLERDAPRESIQAVEKQITRRMQVLNERVRAMEDRN